MQKKKPSPFSQLMQKGHRKVKYSSQKSDVLMLFSEQEHRRIATLIKKWLKEDEQK
ncbi:hypothetical protein [Alteromonas sp. ASW11-130]|uniref:hypothetical protein n=1 Tax=Alteromonas sp. ASW11-130 TaxID=3015775 RepID=UPI002242406B|nr:hypothetical protein [Alteromonas sp. ASW11-130]MCW8092062.1 hypothetical protein [Alteromonas sp. ASW11-130]